MMYYYKRYLSNEKTHINIDSIDIVCAVVAVVSDQVWSRSFRCQRNNENLSHFCIFQFNSDTAA